jgi:hypothetical protein
MAAAPMPTPAARVIIQQGTIGLGSASTLVSTAAVWILPVASIAASTYFF